MNEPVAGRRSGRVLLPLIGITTAALALAACNMSEREEADLARSSADEQTSPATTEQDQWEGTASTRLSAAETAPLGDAGAPDMAAREERAVATADVDEERNKLMSVAETTVAKLADESPQAARLSDEAYGYAVFDAGSAGLLVSGAGGAGVAVEKDTKERTYMYMGAAGAGATAGGQDYRLVLFFENQDAFDDFIDGDLSGSALAQAAIGEAGANAVSEFQSGVAAFQWTEAGLVAGAELRATYFWPSEELNTSEAS